MVARAGAGPDPIPHRQLTADKLAHAIEFCLKPESLERAKILASKIATERGSDTGKSLTSHSQHLLIDQLTTSSPSGALSFHQCLDIDRLRCLLAPSRPATWRIKRTHVRLSAFGACTLANANLLEFSDLKLYRPQEYDTDEGPWDPISGFGAEAVGALSSMVNGLSEMPSETWKALQVPTGTSRKQSQVSLSTMARKSESSPVDRELALASTLEQSQTSLNVQDDRARDLSLSTKSAVSTSNSSTRSSSPSGTWQGQSRPKQDPRENALRKQYCSSRKDHDMLRQTGVHTSKGFGRMVKAVVQAPMDMSVGITKGFHNVPKLWGDDTVRPQQRVKDLNSGLKAVGKEFGYGMYDGITGLVTQPWNGARKEGTSGFFKGMGKGIGGFATKPSAALWSIPSYFMKGAHKEMQKLFGGNVQNYIVASRATQGYEEWLQSSDAEKQDVIERWKLQTTWAG